MGRLANISRKHEESNSLRPADTGGVTGPADKALGPRPQEAQVPRCTLPLGASDTRASDTTEQRAGSLSGRAQRRRAPRHAVWTLCPSLHQSVPSLTLLWDRNTPDSSKVSARHLWLCCLGNLGCYNTGAFLRLAVSRLQQRHEHLRTLAINIPPRCPTELLP